jgi:DNA-binding response OmpR family regulator
VNKVLVVEDDPATSIALRDGLEYEGYEVSTAADGELGLQMAHSIDPDLILLDIMLTARGQEIDKVTGLKVGADDCVTKPFGFIEFMARVEAVLRRSQPSKKKSSYEFGDLLVDYQRFQVFRYGIPIALSAREFELLAYFIEHRGEVVSRAELLEQVWSYRGVSNTRTVDMHVAKLRKKIEDEPAKPRWIATQHGVGYRFEG